MISYQIYRRKNLGFTLVELAIVLVIIGLILTTLLAPLSAQREMSARLQTQKLLNDTKEALMGYALVNGYLPCPDTKAIPDGVENRKVDGTCVSDDGVLPWNTLGVERVDAWEHYFGYHADATFSNSVNLFKISDASGASGIKITGDNGVALVSTVSRPVAVVLSFGANGYGAKNTTQATPANKMPAPTTTDEKENVNGDTDFISRVPSPKGSANEFDDMLVWISPKILVNKMIMAQRLP